MAKERALLKISGESLSGEGNFGFKKEPMHFIAEEILTVKDLFEIAIVIGGGNIVRGTTLRKEISIDPVVADYAGMIGTVINTVVLQNIFEKDFGLKTRVLSAIDIRTVAEPFIRRKAASHLEKNRIILLAGGTGNPDFSTDTAMVLRAHEIGARVVLKGTKVDGIYDDNPQRNPNARFLKEVDYLDYLNRGLEIVDSTAVTQAMRNNIEIKVFNFFTKGNLRKVLVEGNIGSSIRKKAV